jgi:cyanophycinase
MEGTALLDRVREIHADGGVIAGTSAGAAVMSRIMITGDERLHPDDPAFDTIRPNNVVTREGFAFVDLAIIDQHFIARRRHNRLISLVLENPGLVGVGIDEATAIVVGADDRFEVIGEATVVVYLADQAHHVAPDADGDLAAHGMTLHLLRAGEGFDLRARRVIEASER